MNKQEYIERLQAIGTEADEAQRRELIAQMIEDGGNDYDDHAAAVAARDQALADNEDLRAANMRLFKRIGNPEQPGAAPGAPIGAEGAPQSKRKFESLFNEKGELK